MYSFRKGRSTVDAIERVLEASELFIRGPPTSGHKCPGPHRCKERLQFSPMTGHRRSPSIQEHALLSS